MSSNNYKVGMIVTHPNKPEWGQGQVVTVTENSVHIFFQGDPKHRTKLFNRIYLNGPIGWETPGFETTGEKMEADVQYFANPKKIMSLSELNEIKSKLKLVPGVYGWYFKKVPPYVSVKNCHPKRGKFKKWKLLYIGLGSDLKERIFNMHFNGNADSSSLRRSLGCLLTRKLNIFLWKIPTDKEGKYRYTFGEKGEDILSKWLAKHARVVYRENERYKELEKLAIGKYTAPLNTKENPEPFAPLKKLKGDMKDYAAMAGDKPPKKAVKQAYKEFVKNVRDWE